MTAVEPQPGFIRLNFQRLEPAGQLAQAEAFAATLAKRRSVRFFTDEPVPIELIERAIIAAGTSPSGAHQQPWHFAVVSDPAIKRAIREAAEAEERENYERRFPDEWKDALKPIGTDWQKPFLEIAPYLIVVFRRDYGLETGSDGNEVKVKHYYVGESVGIATGFLIAALHHAGLATLTHTPNPMGFLTRILNRPKNEKPFVLLPVGYPAPDCVVPDLTRKPLSEIMSRH